MLAYLRDHSFYAHSHGGSASRYHLLGEDLASNCPPRPCRKSSGAKLKAAASIGRTTRQTREPRLKTISKTLRVPILDVSLSIILTPDVNRERAKLNHLLGPMSPDTLSGLVSCHGHRFWLFLNSADITEPLVAHEVFHAVHRMMEFIGCQLTPESSEAYAHLCGWLTGQVYKLKSK